MRTIMALGTTVLLTLAVIVGWVAWTAPYTDQAKAVTAPATRIDPFELMKKSNGLAHQQYDAF
jgi:predicted negative regulator of RcsB-dependent stress response